MEEIISDGKVLITLRVMSVPRDGKNDSRGTFITRSVMSTLKNDAEAIRIGRIASTSGRSKKRAADNPLSAERPQRSSSSPQRLRTLQSRSRSARMQMEGAHF